MRKIILLTFALLFAATMVTVRWGFCEDEAEMTSEDLAQKEVTRLTKKLDLTADQIPQVEALVKEKVEKKKAVKEEMRTKMESIKEEYSTKIKALLTADQLKKFNEMKNEKKEGEHKKGKDKN